jgi:hypothetical protein
MAKEFINNIGKKYKKYSTYTSRRSTDSTPIIPKKCNSNKDNPMFSLKLYFQPKANELYNQKAHYTVHKINMAKRLF